MNINMMHVGISLGLGRINTEEDLSYEHEELDYFINTVTKQLVRAVLTNEENEVGALLSNSQIRDYYEALQPYIKTCTLQPNHFYGRGYVYSRLPYGYTTGLIETDTRLHKGIVYRVNNAGTEAIFTTVGAVTADWAVGYEWTCDIADLTGATIAIIEGDKYRVLNPGNADTEFATSGLAHCTYGAEWTATASIAGATGWTENPTIEHLTASATTWGAAKITPLDNNNYFLYLSSASNIDMGNAVSSGVLNVGDKYRVDIIGTTDLSGVGGYSYTGQDVVFAATSDATITWLGTTALYKTIDNNNQLVPYKKIRSRLNNSFGTLRSKPYCTLADNEIRVYHDNKFTINELYLDYIKKPVDTDWNNDTDSDLPESLHNALVDVVIQYIAAISGNPVYNAMLNENKDKV